MLLLFLVLLSAVSSTLASYSVSGPSSPFQSIIGLSGASRISNFDSTPNTNFLINLPFTFRYSATASTQFIRVSRGGEIFLGSQVSFAAVRPICDASVFRPRIAAFACGATTTSPYNIYQLVRTSSVIISYEPMRLTGSTGNYLFQVELFSSGSFEVRYGNASAAVPASCTIGFEEQPSVCMRSEFGVCDQTTGLCGSFPALLGATYGMQI
jgi:hypothetical protein